MLADWSAGRKSEEKEEWEVYTNGKWAMDFYVRGK